MRKPIALALILLMVLTGCSSYQRSRLKNFILPQYEENSVNAVKPETSLINEAGTTVAERFQVPEGFDRVDIEEGSFEHYLRSFPLKPHGSPVHLYNGEIKSAKVHAAVMDIEIGDRDLQQCADAAMRLRAEYLYQKGEFEKIHFNFTNGFNADYSKWMQGYRISVSGNKSSWVKSSRATENYQSFRKYLDIVFAYAGTVSLAKEMSPVQLKELQIGDVFIKGGSPGHCVIIIDLAENKETGERLFLLAQSYMPAQEIHVLKNPQKDEGDPWYSLEEGETLDTPEWDFTTEQLMRFP